jgi:hypothetical protein
MKMLDNIETGYKLSSMKVEIKYKFDSILVSLNVSYMNESEKKLIFHLMELNRFAVVFCAHRKKTTMAYRMWLGKNRFSLRYPLRL